MSDAGNGFELRRIVIAIDGSVQASGLEAVAFLAARLEAQIEAVFVEDIELARLAELSVGREICFNGVCRDFTADSVTVQYREQAAIARRAIAAAAAKARVAYAFRIARGQVEIEILSAAGAADLLVLGTGAALLRRPGRLGRIARAAAERAPHSVLIAKPGARALTRPAVLFDGSPGSRRALAAGARIVGVSRDAVAVLLVAEEPDRSAGLRAEAAAVLDARGIRADFLQLGQATPERIARMIREAGADALIIAADAALPPGIDRLTLLEGVDTQILLVR